MSAKNQSNRLTNQHKAAEGVKGIFGHYAKEHDIKVGEVTKRVVERLTQQYPSLQFRQRSTISKAEINKMLQKLDPHLGQTLFVANATIKPDGGVVEVLDDTKVWRVILISEAKHQGKDVDNIKKGKLVGAKNNQDLMAAGNAIERSHKNIAEMANFMLQERHFPYVLFLTGSNFLTETIHITRPDGRVVELEHDSGMLNRMDRLTAANYGLPINTNLCENRFFKCHGASIMLQAASIYTEGKGNQWDPQEMFNVMLDISRTSLRVLGSDLFNQITS